MSHQGESANRTATRLDAVEETLRAVKADVGALEELSARLARTVEALEAEVGMLAEQARSEASEPSDAQSSRSRDLDGARLVALNMALNGDSREETGRYLAESFEIAEPERLLDEVYAAIGG